MSGCPTDWGMVIAIIASNITLAGILVGVMIWIFSKLDSDIKGVATRIDGVAQKIDADMRAQMARTDQLNARTDQLYKMFIDLLENQNKPKTNR